MWLRHQLGLVIFYLLALHYKLAMMPATSCNKPLRMSPVTLNLGLKEGSKGIHMEVTLAFVPSLLVYLCTCNGLCRGRGDH
jgi:hypothetical protein